MRLGVLLTLVIVACGSACTPRAASSTHAPIVERHDLLAVIDFDGREQPERDVIEFGPDSAPPAHAHAERPLAKQNP